MSLMGLLVFILILALIIWAIGIIPLPPILRQAVYIVIAVVVILTLVDSLGVFGPSFIHLH